MPAIADRILTVFGVSAAIIIIAASMAINAEFAYSRAVHPHLAMIYGAAAAAADLIKSLFGLYAVRAWQARQFARAGAAIVFAALGTVFSLSSAFGLIAESRNERFTDRANLNERLDHVRKQRSDAELRRPGKASRSVIELQGTIESILQRPVTVGQRVRGTVGSVSNGCQAVDRSTRESCKEISALREELSRAVAAAQLKQEIFGLWAEEGELRKKGAGLEPDGQGAAFAEVLRTSIAKMNLTLALLLALVIEAGSSLGLFIVTGHGRSSSAAKAEKTEPGSGEVRLEEVLAADAANKVPLSVEDYWLERLFPALGQKVSVAEVVEDYCAYCKQRGLSALAPGVFEAEFRDICAKIGLKISNGFAMGVRVGGDDSRIAA